MRSSLDCLPCLLKQSLTAARLCDAPAEKLDALMRRVLLLLAEQNLEESPPALAQRVHRLLRNTLGVADPYAAIKGHFNRMALGMLPLLRERIRAASDPFQEAVKLAIVGNVIDLGVYHSISADQVEELVSQAAHVSLHGDTDILQARIQAAQTILYLADNAGEIAFDRLLIEQLPRERVTLAVRGAPAINDATLADAHAVGLHELVSVCDNGSDAPGTILEDCSPDFRERFAAADLILAKGQGNYESLSGSDAKICFLFKVKCPLIAAHSGLPQGAHALLYHNNRRKS